MNKRILLCGVDLPLLSTRAAVLSHNKFLTSHVHDLDALRAAIESFVPDLVILCHSLSKEMRQAAVATVRELQPSSKILLLTTTFIANETDGCQNFNAFDGPRALVETTRQLTML